MTKRNTAFVAIPLLFLIGLLWWSLHERDKTDGPRNAAAAVPADSISPDATSPKMVRSDSTLEQDRQELFRQHEMEKQEATRKAFETKIDFFGKVVDEDGRPIAAAITSYIVTTRSLSGNPTESGPASGADGRFSITGKQGPRLVVMVAHPAYYQTDSAEQIFSYAMSSTNDMRRVPTINDPAIFVLRAKGISDALIRRNIQTHLPLDGTPISVDLVDGQIGSNTRNSIVLSLRSDGNKLPLNQYYPFDWDMRVGVPGGGLLEHQEKFQFQAPSEGYKSEISYSSSGSLPRGKWLEEVEDNYFVLLPSGNHARLHLQMAPTKGGCQIESFVNPNPNSRNLEFDPAKEIKTK